MRSLKVRNTSIVLNILHSCDSILYNALDLWTRKPHDRVVEMLRKHYFTDVEGVEDEQINRDGKLLRGSYVSEVAEEES